MDIKLGQKLQFKSRSKHSKDDEWENIFKFDIIKRHEPFCLSAYLLSGLITTTIKSKYI